MRFKEVEERLRIKVLDAARTFRLGLPLNNCASPHHRPRVIGACSGTRAEVPEHVPEILLTALALGTIGG
jgi:hypothetical protein